MFSWFKKKPPTYNRVKISIVFAKSDYERINTVLSNSSHPDLNKLIGEAFKVVEAVYQQHHKFHRDVTCKVVNGKIEMYVDGPGDGGEPIEVGDDNNIVILFPKAA